MALTTGEDVARVIGLPASTADTDTAAAVADELVAAYCVTPLPEPVPAPVAQAALQLAVNVYQAAAAAGGQNVAMDWTPGPYRMGRSLLSTVSGLLAPWQSTGSMVG